MTLETELYSSDITMGESIDKAWAIYNDTGMKEEERHIAQGYLIYAFDIRNPDDINEQIIKLIADRNLHKISNPEYIPNLIPPDIVSKELLLRVNEESSTDDRLYNTPYYTAQERAKYRVHIYKGTFYKNQQKVDTKDMSAHLKEGYAAFTVNIHGELSVFNHSGLPGDPLHSSMNEGKPVLFAGELVISNGVLRGINTYSGHYQPSFFDIYRTLEFFHTKKVDLSKAYIYLKEEPIYIDFISFDSREAVYINREVYFKIPASMFFYTIEEKLAIELDNITSDIDQYQSNSPMNILFQLKDSITSSSLTKERQQLAKELKQKISEFKTPTESGPEQLTKLISYLSDVKKHNNDISSKHSKNIDSGRLNDKIDHYIQKAQAIQNLNGLKKPLSESHIMEMKHLH